MLFGIKSSALVATGNPKWVLGFEGADSEPTLASRALSSRLLERLILRARVDNPLRKRRNPATYEDHLFGESASRTARLHGSGGVLASRARGCLRMKCPYCAEEIQDAAVLCRHCGRDFFLTKPLMERIAAAEREIIELKAALQNVAVTPSGPAHRPPRGGLRATLLPALVAGGLYLLFRALTYEADTSNELTRAAITNIAVLIPGVCGFLFGFRSSGWKQSLSVGAYAALFIVVINLMWRQFGSAAVKSELQIHAITFPLFVLAFFLPAILGRWIGKRFNPSPDEPRNKPAPKLAVGLAHLGSPNSEAELLKRIEFWKKIIDAFTPILTLAGTIITAYLAYLASGKK